MSKAKATPSAFVPSPRETILLTARDLTCGDRNTAYNDPRINMMAFAELQEWATKWQKLSLDSTASDVAHHAAMVMVYAKLARIVVGEAKADNYIDAAAYLAMAWECHAREVEAL